MTEGHKPLGSGPEAISLEVFEEVADRQGVDPVLGPGRPVASIAITVSGASA